ncbi:hypothetical protein BST99_02255 [Aureicoccus marinus]|uniref:TonB-dependent receptor plug domain-containing protein n=1 Tax=Aureicoccus marinus TaxID=754435 RepID=A0A2S7T571_9FLAO|nr:hypothetical protein BST99_02255 [Aureicoccus marinus]
MGLFGAFAQVEVKGIVVFDDKPVEGASVFLSGTTYGTVSSDTGEFLLEVPEGKYSLVVSHLGFKNVVYELNTAELPERLKVVMEEGEIALKEVVLEGKMSAEDRAYFLNQFKSEFIGRGLFSNQCKLLNPDDLRFSYDRQSGTLRFMPTRPLFCAIRRWGMRSITVWSTSHSKACRPPFWVILATRRSKEISASRNNGYKTAFEPMPDPGVIFSRPLPTEDRLRRVF